MFFKGIKNKFRKAVYNRFVCYSKKIFYLICVTPQLDIFCDYFVKFLEKIVTNLFMNGHSRRK